MAGLEGGGALVFTAALSASHVAFITAGVIQGRSLMLLVVFSSLFDVTTVSGRWLKSFIHETTMKTMMIGMMV